MSKPGFCVTEDASIKVGVRLGPARKTRARAYIPNPVMLHATRAPTTPVAAPNERGRENIPAPTMDLTAMAVSANNDSRRPVSDMVAPSRFAGGILRAWCSRKLYAAGSKGHPANAAKGRTIGAGQRPNGRCRASSQVVWGIYACTGITLANTISALMRILGDASDYPLGCSAFAGRIATQLGTPVGIKQTPASHPEFSPSEFYVHYSN